MIESESKERALLRKLRALGQRDPSYGHISFYADIDALLATEAQDAQGKRGEGEKLDVPMGESRWLIEGTANYPTRRCFWTGSFWAHDYLASEPPALKAARYWSKESAEAVIQTIKSISTDTVHNIAAFDHMFQCGISPSATDARAVAKDADRWRKWCAMNDGCYWDMRHFTHGDTSQWHWIPRWKMAEEIDAAIAATKEDK